MPRFSSHLGRISSEVKAFVADRFSAAHLRHGLHQALDTLLPPQGLDMSSGDALVMDAPQPVMQAGMNASAWARIRFLDGEGCDMCARPMDGLYGGINGLCSACLEKPFPFVRTRCACLYDDASRDLILKFKHADRTDLAPMLTRWIERAGAEIFAGADVIIPVPLHPLRLLKRRYNQAAELARPVAKRVGCAYAPGALVRVRATVPQAKDEKARRANVKGAFKVTAKGAKLIAGKKVVLIDDVFTTGATLSACAEVLLATGASRVDCVTIARAAKVEW